MRIIDLNEFNGQVNQYLLIPETHCEKFLLWVLSFSTGRWVSNLAKPFYRSLIVEHNTVVSIDGNLNKVYT